MSVWKRYRGKKVKRGHKDYDRGTWIAEGKVDGTPYKKALPRETVKTAEQARAADDVLRAQIRSGDIRDDARFSTFTDAVYLPYWQMNKASYRQKVYQCARLKKFFGNDKLKSIRPSRCEEFKRWRSSQNTRCQKCETGREHDCEPNPVKPGTVNHDLITLSSIFERARADGKIISNPMEFVPMLDIPDTRDRVLETDERERLWPVIQKTYQLYCFVVIALLTGWRKQQILHLRRSDMENGKVWIIKQKRRPRRLVKVHPLVWNILVSMSEVREDWLFVNRSGNRLGEIIHSWWKACQEAGIEGLHIHDLRHSFSTEMLETGAGEFTINHALGHVRLETTQRYAHVKDHLLETALAGLRVDDIPLPDAIQTPSQSVM